MRGICGKYVNAISYDLHIKGIICDDALKDSYTLHPGEFIFVQTREMIHMPKDLIGRIGEKNSRIRQGLSVAGPHYYPGHKTYSYLRIQNITCANITIRENDSIAQIIFEQLESVPEKAYDEQKVLVVTSVSENEGKSTVAANLAITLAEQSKRVLLVDGDIRRPSQFLIFGMEPKEENELGEYLRGNGSLADVMVPCTRKHMLFMGGKNCYSSSTEMLNSESFFKLMAACRKFVDYVIIDTPPAGIIGDAQIFAHCADAVMIVSKQNYMLAEDINEVMDAFRDKEGKVLGVVLNGSQALAHARNRTLGNDFERTRRQRSVMYGIYRKIMEKKDPSALLPLINYAVNHVRTNMSVSEMYSMAKDVLSVDDLKMQQTCIPQDGTYTDITYEGMQVLKVDFDANKKKIEQLLY